MLEVLEKNRMKDPEEIHLEYGLFGTLHFGWHVPFRSKRINGIPSLAQEFSRSSKVVILKQRDYP